MKFFGAARGADLEVVGHAASMGPQHAPALAEDEPVNLWGSRMRGDNNGHTHLAIEKSQAPLLLRLADAIPSGVINSQFAKERSLRFDVPAVADHDDLHVCGVEIRSGGGHNIFGL